MDIDGNLKRFAAGKSPFTILTPAEPFHRGDCLVLSLVTLEDGVVSNSNKNVFPTWKQKKYYYYHWLYWRWMKQGIIHSFLSHLIINLPEIMYIFCRKLYNLISDFRTFRWSYCILHQIFIINCLLYLLYWILSHFSNKWLTFSTLLSELYITY